MLWSIDSCRPSRRRCLSSLMSKMTCPINPPCLQNPLSYQGQSFILDSGSIWRYWHSLLLHSPENRKVKETLLKINKLFHRIIQNNNLKGQQKVINRRLQGISTSYSHKQKEPSSLNKSATAQRKCNFVSHQHKENVGTS